MGGGGEKTFMLPPRFFSVVLRKARNIGGCFSREKAQEDVMRPLT